VRLGAAEVPGALSGLALAPLFWLDAAALRLLGSRLIAGTLVAGLVFLLLPAELGHRPLEHFPSDRNLSRFTDLSGRDSRIRAWTEQMLAPELGPGDI
jgi:hypothetical protein